MTIKHPNLARSTLINLAGAIIPAILMLVTVPLYIHLIGEARYGVLAIVWLLLGYFGVFDLGFGRAVANRIAALHEAPAEDRQRIFWTGLVISIFTGFIGGILLYGLGDWLFANAFDVHGPLRQEAEQAMPWLVLALPLAITISLLAGALEGRQEFFALTSSQMAGTVLYRILPLIVAYTGLNTLPYLIPAVLLGRLVSLLLLFINSHKKIPLTYRPRFSRAEARKLLSYGGWISVTGLISPLLTIFDRFVIGAKLGMVAVTTYTIPNNLGNYIAILPGSLQMSLFPRFAMLNDEEGAKLALRATLVLAAFMGPLITLALLLIKPFLTIWVGGSLSAAAAPVGQILLLGIWVNTLAFIPFAYLQGSGRPAIVAKFHLIELLPYMVALWILIDMFGIQGAAWAWDLRVGIDALLLFYAAHVFPGLISTSPASLPIIGAFVLANYGHKLSAEYLFLACIFLGGEVLWSLYTFERVFRARRVRSFSPKVLFADLFSIEDTDEKF
jgi:O-antigen/teichoic acid export membrane protein